MLKKRATYEIVIYSRDFRMIESGGDTSLSLVSCPLAFANHPHFSRFCATFSFLVKPTSSNILGIFLHNYS